MMLSLGHVHDNVTVCAVRVATTANVRTSSLELVVPPRHHNPYLLRIANAFAIA